MVSNCGTLGKRTGFVKKHTLSKNRFLGGVSAQNFRASSGTQQNTHHPRRLLARPLFPIRIAYSVETKEILATP
jgi:hypothetical protein